MFAFLHIIAVITILSLMVFFLYLDRKSQKANQNYPSLLITIGIGFTFFGVALGLMDFNTDDPTAGLAVLVNGIKTAFWGSFTGVAASIILRFHSLMCLKENVAESRQDDQLNQFYQEHTALSERVNYLQTINTTLNNNNENLIRALTDFGLDLDQKNKINMQEMLQAITTSLNGIEQIQRSTQGYIASEIAELRGEFVIFAQKQSEQTTEIFIRALEQAIQRFNENLTNSLGDNFKQLNVAITQLVEWQNQYATHVEDQTQHYAVMLEQVNEMKDDFSAVLANVNQFNQIIQQLETAIASIDYKNTEFNSRIESFYGALDSKIVDIEHARQLLDNGFKASESHMQNMQATSEKIFDEINGYLEASHTRALNTQKQSVEHIDQMQQQIKQSFESTQQQLSENLTTLDNQLQQTLNQSLITLAQQLGSLSTKFAQDYEPITTNLKKVMDSMGRGIQ